MTIKRHDRDRLRMIQQKIRECEITQSEAEELTETQVRKIYGGATLIK